MRVFKKTNTDRTMRVQITDLRRAAKKRTGATANMTLYFDHDDTTTPEKARDFIREKISSMNVNGNPCQPATVSG